MLWESGSAGRWYTFKSFPFARFEDVPFAGPTPHHVHLRGDRGGPPGSAGWCQGQHARLRCMPCRRFVPRFHGLGRLGRSCGCSRVAAVLWRRLVAGHLLWRLSSTPGHGPKSCLCWISLLSCSGALRMTREEPMILRGSWWCGLSKVQIYERNVQFLR